MFGYYLLLIWYTDHRSNSAQDNIDFHSEFITCLLQLNLMEFFHRFDGQGQKRGE